MANKKWDFLKRGDIVDIIAPASHSPDLKLGQGLDWIKSLGLIPRVFDGMIQPDAFFAAPLETQLLQLQEALYSDSKAIWCLRGGYGSMRLIPFLKKMRPPKRPKLFVGFSDITSLHLYFNQAWGWPTIHGRTISQLSPELGNSHDRKILKKLIFGQLDEMIFKGLRPLNEAARDEQTITGKITGGNLRILQSSLGTDWELKAKGKILFIEDVSERGYSIDRMLEQMVQAKIIHKGLKALVVGDFTGGQEKDGVNFTETALKRFAQRVDYPVLKGLPCGHGDKFNYPLPFETSAVLNLGKKSELRCEIGGALSKK